MKSALSVPIAPVAHLNDPPSFVRIGTDRFPIESLSEAVACWNAAVEEYGWGSSDCPKCLVYFFGRNYRISYNGRVWDSVTGTEVPVDGRKTAAQCEAEGWR